MKHGKLSAEFPSGTQLFLHQYARSPAHAVDDQIDPLRAALRQVRARHPFTIEATVILPDHLHAIWTLPEQDADFDLR